MSTFLFKDNQLLVDDTVIVPSICNSFVTTCKRYQVPTNTRALNTVIKLAAKSGFDYNYVLPALLKYHAINPDHAETLAARHKLYHPKLSKLHCSKDDIDAVFKMLQSRKIHPSGTFDKAGRFYAEHECLIDVRQPSRSHPYSEMAACRTRKYVTRVAAGFKCKSIPDLIRSV